MSLIETRPAFAFVRRSLESRHGRLRPCATVRETVLAERPDLPMHCQRPHVLSATAERFRDLFPGKVLYAVKCNPEPSMLRALWAGGIRHFDCASVQEVRLVRKMFPAAHLHFMHPIKSRPAIREAWEWHGVRDFVIDSAAELSKVVAVTGGGDLGLIVRLALPKGKALCDLSGKFGAVPAEAVALLRAARSVARRVGLCFHVGSQCMDPAAFTRALALAGGVLDEAGVALDVLDVGGGFPVSYPDLTPPPLDAFIAAIADGVHALNLPPHTEIWCEPGRALVASGQSVVVRVEARRGDALHINDGVYGTLSDAGVPGFRFPCRLIRAGVEPVGELAPFTFFGPTCDSADHMKGPFMLPADVREGDWIEIGQLGAYGTTLRTPFNGFDQSLTVEVSDRPLLDTPGHAPDTVRAA